MFRIARVAFRNGTSDHVLQSRFDNRLGKGIIVGVELLMAVTFCTEIEYIKRNSLVGLGYKVAFCSVSNGDEITLYGIAFPAIACA